MPRFLMRFAWLMGIAGTLLSVRPIAAQDDAQLRKIAADAYDVFSNHCYSCHGAQIKFPGLYILEQDSLIADRGEDLDRYVEPGKPEESEVWYRAVSIGDMPPSGPLSDEEKDKIVRWIEAGAR